MRRFAQKLAEHGFVTIAADAAYQGASGGTPRQTDRPANRVEDIRAMVDFISTYLYLTKGIPFKAGLYALYTAMAIAGYYKWKRMMQQQHDTLS